MKEETVKAIDSRTGKPREMVHTPLSIPGHTVALLASDEEKEYFYLVLIPRNLETFDEVIVLGGPFAREEFQDVVFKE